MIQVELYNSTMIEIAVISLLLFLIVIICFVISGTLLEFVGELLTDVPFVPVKKELLPHIAEALGANEKSVVYDIGSGDGRVVSYIAKECRPIKAIGIEIAPLPYLVARFKRKRSGLPVTFIRRNMFQVPLSDATHVFCYLLTKTMEKLEPKFAEELKNARLVSCDFRLKHKEPSATLRVPVGKKTYTLYTYEF